MARTITDKVKFYTESPVTYTENALYSEHLDESIMSNHEDLIMKESAKVLCQNGGSVLNIGFGMGIIDSYIRDLTPAQHSIIEIHPQIVQKAKDMGFEETATIYEGDWRLWADKWRLDGTKFDAIYFDTYSIVEDEWFAFITQVDFILNEGGIFCYFNGSAAKLGKNIPMYTNASYGYTIHSKTIPASKIVEAVDEEFDENLLEKQDYELIWLTK